jgi:hypothetical protein
MFSGPADQWNRDYSDSYSNLQGMTERFSTGGTGDGEVGPTGGFGTPIAEAASNQAIKGAAAFSGMRPEELAGAVQNVPTGSQAGSGITEGLGLLSKEELDYVDKQQVGPQKTNDMLAIARSVEKRIAERLGITATMLPNGELNFGSNNTEAMQEFSRQAEQAYIEIFTRGGAPEIAETYRRASRGGTTQPTAASGSPSSANSMSQKFTSKAQAVQFYADKIRKKEGREPTPEEIARINSGLSKMGIQ